LIDYFGQTPPDTIPVIFAPGNICLDNRFEARGAFSPDGRLFYFTVTNEDFTFQKILFCEYLNNKWTKPDTASFSKTFNNHEPFFSNDGQNLFFTSARKVDADNVDLYVSFNTNGIWSEPVNMGNLINTKANEYSPFLSPDGKYLFFVRHDGINGDIFWINASIINKFKSKAADLL
jgi:Tol biopolymer transport system component